MTVRVWLVVLFFIYSITDIHMPTVCRDKVHSGLQDLPQGA